MADEYCSEYFWHSSILLCFCSISATRTWKRDLNIYTPTYSKYYLYLIVKTWILILPSVCLTAQPMPCYLQVCFLGPLAVLLPFLWPIHQDYCNSLCSVAEICWYHPGLEAWNWTVKVNEQYFLIKPAHKKSWRKKWFRLTCCQSASECSATSHSADQLSPCASRGQSHARCVP